MTRENIFRILDLPWDVTEKIICDKSLSFQDALNLLEVMSISAENTFLANSGLWERKFHSSYPDLYQSLMARKRRDPPAPSAIHLEPIKFDIPWLSLLAENSTAATVERLTIIRRKCTIEQLCRHHCLRTQFYSRFLSSDPCDIRYPRPDGNRSNSPAYPEIPKSSVKILGKIPRMSWALSAFEVLPVAFERINESDYSERTLLHGVPFSNRIFDKVKCKDVRIAGEDWTDRFVVDQYTNILESTDLDYLKTVTSIALIHARKTQAIREIEHILKEESSTKQDDANLVLAFIQSCFPGFAGLQARVTAAAYRITKHARSDTGPMVESHGRTLLGSAVEKINKILQREYSPFRSLDYFSAAIGFSSTLHLMLWPEKVLDIQTAPILGFYVLALQLKLKVHLQQLLFDVRLSNGNRSHSVHILLPFMEWKTDELSSDVFIVLPSSNGDCRAVIVSLTDADKDLPQLVAATYLGELTAGATITLTKSAVSDPCRIRDHIYWWMSNGNLQSHLKCLRLGNPLEEDFHTEVCVRVANNNYPRYPFPGILQNYWNWIAARDCVYKFHDLSPLLDNSVEGEFVNKLQTVEQQMKSAHDRLSERCLSRICDPHTELLLPLGSIISYRRRNLIPTDVRRLDYWHGVIIGREIGESSGQNAHNVSYEIIPLDIRSPLRETQEPFYNWHNIGIITEIVWPSDFDVSKDALLSDSRLMLFFDKFDGLFLIPNAALSELHPDDETTRLYFRSRLGLLNGSDSFVVSQTSFRMQDASD